MRAQHTFRRDENRTGGGRPSRTRTFWSGPQEPQGQNEGASAASPLPGLKSERLPFQNLFHSPPSRPGEHGGCKGPERWGGLLQTGR